MFRFVFFLSAAVAIGSYFYTRMGNTAGALIKPSHVIEASKGLEVSSEQLKKLESQQSAVIDALRTKYHVGEADDDTSAYTAEQWSKALLLIEHHGYFTSNETTQSHPRKQITRHCLLLLSGHNKTIPAVNVKPEFSRVKNWLWVHDRYRTQMQGLIDEADALVRDAASKSAKIPVLQASFEKFAKKVESHSDFESTQLFKFFIEHPNFNDNESLASPSTLEAFIGLTGEHKSQHVLEDKVRSTLTSALAEETFDVKLVQEVIKEYVDDMLAHMKREETAVVHRWLSLTPEEYSLYRSYLSWVYSAMY